MIAKTIALVSVTTLTVVVSLVAAAGCSSSSPDPGVEALDAAPDVKPDTGGPQPDPDVDEPSNSCISMNSIDASKYPYAAAAVSAGSCTADDLSALSAYFDVDYKAGRATVISEWSKEVSDDCAKCVFGAEGDAEWHPILTKGDGIDNVNRGGCIEIVSGVAACGRAYQQVTECRRDACASCETQAEFNTCFGDLRAIAEGPCLQAFAALRAACGEELTEYEKACEGQAWTFEGPIRVQCITGGEREPEPDAGDGD